MAEADLIVFIDGWQNSRGCKLEYEIARQYDVPTALAYEITGK